MCNTATAHLQRNKAPLCSPAVDWKPLRANRWPPVLFAADCTMLPGALLLPTETERPVLVVNLRYPMHLRQQQQNRHHVRALLA
jgi:hypothetical protein